MRLINWRKIATFACRRLAAIHTSPLDRFYLMRALAGELRPDYRFKWPDVDWWQDATFNEYLQLFGEADGMNTDRRWMLAELLRLVDGVAGDTAECGVYRGASSYLICAANEFSSAGRKTHHLFDSFAGLSTPGRTDGDHWTAGDLTCELDIVRANLSRFSQTAYYPGWIPARFQEVADRRFSLVHIDVDLHQPTRDSIAFFYPRLSDGGVLVCDDYGIGSCPGATAAVDEYLADKPEKMIRLSAGAGFLIKGVAVAGDQSRTEAMPMDGPQHLPNVA